MSNLAVIGVVSGLLAWIIFALASMHIIPQSRRRHWYHGRDSSPVSLLYLIAFLAGLSALIFAWLGYRNGEDFYANLATECASVAVTIFVIDYLYDRRSKLEEKQRIIEQMRSPSAEFAKEAIRIVDEKGWLRDGSLRGANMMDAHLNEAYLTGAHLERAFLRGAHLEKANLKGAHLEETDLVRTHLNVAHLVGAHLVGANLMAAHLEEAYLTGAHLEGAYLMWAHLKGTHLEGATYDVNTIWPEGFDQIEAGAVCTD